MEVVKSENQLYIAIVDSWSWNWNKWRWWEIFPAHRIIILSWEIKIYVIDHRDWKEKWLWWDDWRGVSLEEIKESKKMLISYKKKVKITKVINFLKNKIKELEKYII